MRFGVLRRAAVIACIGWGARTLGCDPSPSKTASTFVDTDGDGLSDTDEVAIYGTSPILADTDGDAISDYDEVIAHAFDPRSQPLLYNPRVADVPEVRIHAVGPPVLTLRLIATNGETWTWETSQTFEQSVETTVGVTEETSFANTLGGSDAVSREVSVEFQDGSLALTSNDGRGDDEGKKDDSRRRPSKDDPPKEDAKHRDPKDRNARNRDVTRREGGGPPLAFDPGGPTAITFTTGANATVDWSTTNSVTLSFTAQQTRGLRQALTLAQSYAASHEISATGAILKVLFEIENVGTRAVRFDNLIMAASMALADGTLIALGNLEITQNITNFYPISIAPGGRQGPINFSNDNLTLDQFAILAANMQALVVNVGVYDIVDENGKPYAFDAPRIAARTATLDVDYGGMRPHERHLVATNLDPGRPGVTMQRALEDILRMPFDADDERGLTSLRNVAAERAGQWTVELRHIENGEVSTMAFQPPYDFRHILLRAGDVVHLTWSPP